MAGYRQSQAEGLSWCLARVISQSVQRFAGLFGEFGNMSGLGCAFADSSRSCTRKASEMILGARGWRGRTNQGRAEVIWGTVGKLVLIMTAEYEMVGC